MTDGEPEAPVEIGLAGEFAVRLSGTSVPLRDIASRKARTLVKLLAVERGNRVGVDRISAVLWPDDPPRRPAENVATLVSRLRAALGPDAVDGTRDGYRLGGAVRVDLDEAAADVAEARHQLYSGGGDVEAGAKAADAALAVLGHGTALADEPDADWAQPARAEAAHLLREARHLGAQAALARGGARLARDLATEAVDDDPWDESAHRLLMRAEAALGEPARALAVYERFRARVADEFGVDPAPETREIHLAILREQAAEHAITADPAPAGAPVRPAGFVGRDDEYRRLRAAWATGAPALLLVTGEAGIGKTRLAAEFTTELAGEGALVLSVRCYEAERSLFLQPFAEALAAHAAARGADARRLAAEPWAEPLTALLPELTPPPRTELSRYGEVARRRAYDAVVRYLREVAGATPTVLVLDDLHQAGAATVELLHYLVRQAGTVPLLVLATARDEEGADVLAALADVATRVELGPLTGAEVAQLARAAGHADDAAGIAARTRGHPLFVVESLRALTGGRDGIPDTLAAAVSARVRRAGEGTGELLRAAAVLGAAIEPDTLARLLDLPVVTATSRCEQALAARLLTVSGRAYEFANDLIREVLYATTPAPTRVAYHRRAADLLEDRPEAVAAHAAAAGDRPRAARAWLLAGGNALARGAATDAAALLTLALDAADDSEVAARIHLERGRALDARAEHQAAWDSFLVAADTARTGGDRRLEMIALRELGGDVPIWLGKPLVEVTGYLDRALAIADALGDHVLVADTQARLAVLAHARLHYVDALAHAERAVRVARSVADDRALAVALDGLKTAYAYLGEIDLLVPVLDELEPLLRRQGDLWRLPWLLQESAFPAIAAARWDEAGARLLGARDVAGRSGYLAYDAWFLGQMSFVARMAGDVPAALDHARRAYELTDGSIHAWWRGSALAAYGVALAAAGQESPAVDVLREGAALTSVDGAQFYRLRCLAPLAEITRDPAVLAEADELLASVTAPDGTAWLCGAEVYLAVARAWRAAGASERAEAVLAPLRGPAARNGWTWVVRAAG